MKTLIALALLLATPAFASTADDDIFYGELLSISCDYNRKIQSLNGTCLITLRNTQIDEEEVLGLVISESLMDGGNSLSAGKPIFVDLTYTENRTGSLSRYFPAGTAKVFFHDDRTSFGSYDDVIKEVRR